MTRTKARKRLALAGCLMLWAASLAAADSLDFKLGAGPDSKLAGAAFSAAMDKDNTLSLDGNIDFNTITHTAKPDETTDASLKLDWSGKEAWSGVASIDGTDDTRNATTSGGVTLSGTWTLRRPGDAGQADEGNSEILALTLGAGLSDYKVDLAGNSVLAYTQSGKGYTVDHKGILTLPQFAPSLGVEVPLFDGTLTPSVTYTYDHYGANPKAVANVLEQQVLLGPGAGRVYSLVTQIYRQSWNWQLALNLPWNLILTGTWVHSELVTGSVWQDMPSISLAATFGEHWSGHVTWSSIVVDGAASPQTELGAGYQW
jgi:hypothetical protein